MPVPDQEWARAVALLSDAPSVALACHVDPDGDALGSMLALAHVLRSRGVDVVAGFGTSSELADDESVPQQYDFLPGLDALVDAAGFPPAPDVLVAFDTASPDRLGSLQRVVDAAQTVVVIDHHKRGEAFGDIRLCDGDAAATAVLVEELIRRLAAPLDRDIATCLYVGLVTDTGRFQYASTTPAVMELGARLLAHDIDHTEINRQLWEAHSFGYLKVLGRAMDRAALVPDANMAWTVVYRSDLADLGLDPPELEGLIDVLNGLEAVDTALILKEQPSAPSAKALWKASLRSKGDVDVGRIATTFGGGGHTLAAGFTADGEAEVIAAKVAARVRDATGARSAAVPHPV